MPRDFPYFLLPLVVSSLPFFSSFLRDHLVQISYIKDGGTEVQKVAQLAPSHLAS